MIIQRTMTHGLLALLCASAIACSGPADDVASTEASAVAGSSLADQTGLQLPEDRVAQFDVRPQTQQFDALDVTDELAIELFDDEVVHFRRTRLSPTPRGFTWSGKSRSGTASAIITNHRGVVTGLIIGERRTLELRSNARNELVLIDIVDPIRVADHDDQHSGPRERPDDLGVGAPVGGPVTIRVLMMYTDEAIKQADPLGWLGYRNEAYIESKIATEFAVLNDALENSNIRHRAVIADFQKSGRAESGLLTGHIDFLESRIQTPGSLIDGYRTSANADLVQLWLSNERDYNLCGLANIPSVEGIAFAKKAVSVVVTGCGKYTAAHELGHNIGAGHDKYTSPGGGIYDFSYGHTNQDDTRYSLMAYDDKCKDNKGPWETCNQVPVFSGPNVVYRGSVMGGVNHDNAKTIRTMAPNTVTYRTWRP